MSLKLLVNDTKIWDAFNVELDNRLAFAHKQLELTRDTNELYRLQGEVRTLRSFKQLREKVNGTTNESF